MPPADYPRPELEVCPYCRVVAGTAAAEILYADELVLAILDPAPVTLGHTLLLPRHHYPSLTALPVPVLHRLMELAPLLGQVLMRTVDADGFNLHLANGFCAGQAVLHCSLHLIPRQATDGFAWHWRALPTEPARQNDLAARLRERLATATALDTAPAPAATPAPNYPAGPVLRAISPGRAPCDSPA